MNRYVYNFSMLKDVQCPSSGCGGMAQFTISSDEEIVDVLSGGSLSTNVKECPECGGGITIKTY